MKKQNGKNDYKTSDLLATNKKLTIELEKTKNLNIQLNKSNVLLMKNSDRYKALTKTPIFGCLVVDLKGNLLEVNDFYCKLSGFSKKTLLSMNIRDLEVDKTEKQIDEEIKEIINCGSLEILGQHRRSNRSIFYVIVSCTFLPQENTIISLLYDVTNKRKERKRLLYISNHDYLTGLYNRISFEKKKKQLGGSQDQLPISIIFGDVDGLKLINDSFGHSKGDKILMQISMTLKNCCKDQAFIARIGGDEFGIILTKTNNEAAQLVCNCIYKTSNELLAHENLVFPSISLGLATKILPSENMDEILMEAEKYMYRDKLLKRKSVHSSIISSIQAIMFEKSQETEEHNERMTLLSKAIGQALHLKESHIKELELVSTLHDIGKISIDVDILSKPSKLSEKEFAEIKKHPEIGYRIACSIPELVPIANYILSHHERWDGKGYPQGLSGEKIPLPSRIVAILDAYDAMTHDRSYRTAMTHREAIEEIKRNSGTQFDPNISRIFIEKVLGEKWEDINIEKFVD